MIFKSLLFFLLCLPKADSKGNASTFSASGFEDGEVSVKLEVIVAETGARLLEAEDTTDVQLHATLDADDGSQGISLFNCKAVSEDGAAQTQLTDLDGCAAVKSPMGCMVEDKNGTVVSPVFKLSSLAGSGHVNITCCWEMCSERHDSKCSDRCAYFTKQHSLDKQKTALPKSRRPRRDGKTEAERRHATTMIRVLPSHVRRAQHHHRGPSGHHGHHAQGHMRSGSAIDPEIQFQEAQILRESSPLLYLNPITCSIFLLVLAVFLGLFVSFVRSLRHSVHDIKREIEAQRSRDKFLVQ